MRIIKELMEIWPNEVCDRINLFALMRLILHPLALLLNKRTNTLPWGSFNWSTSFCCFRIDVVHQDRNIHIESKEQEAERDYICKSFLWLSKKILMNWQVCEDAEIIGIVWCGYQWSRRACTCTKMHQYCWLCCSVTRKMLAYQVWICIWTVSEY